MFEFVFSSNISNAVDTEYVLNSVTNLAGGIVSIIFWTKRITAVGLSFAIDFLTAQLAKTSGTSTEGGVFDNIVITPFDIFFNKYKLLDVNFFDLDVDKDTITYTFRTTVANWFYAMRLVASSILMVILIYIGIRMAISTVAEDKAKYKKMLFDWVCSLLLIFVLQYIAIFTIYCNNAIVAALKSTISDLSTEYALGNVLVEIGLKGVLGVGITSIAAVLVFVFIVFQTIAFLIAYINRMIKVGFLIIISPLISLTYSIDKIGDGKAQALGTWLKEFIYTVLIQPFHCIMYMAFVRPAISLLVNPGSPMIGISILGSSDYNQLVNGVLAILCLKFINDGEKVVRKIFGFQDDNASTSMAAGMAVGMMAVKNAKKIGGTARKGVNTFKNTSSKFSKSVSSDMQKFKASDNKILKGIGTAGEKLGNVSDKVKSSKVAGKLSEANKKIGENKTISKLKTWTPKSLNGRLKAAANQGGLKGLLAKQTLKHNSLSSTLGMMGAAMAYSTGSTDALTAIGIGSATAQGAQELFATSDNNLANSEVENDRKEDEKEYEKLNESIEELENDIKEDKDALNDTDGFNKYKESMEEAKKKEEIAELEEEKARKQQEQADAIKEKGRKAQAQRYADDARKRAEKAREEAEKIRQEASEAVGSDEREKRFEKMLNSSSDDPLGLKQKEEKLNGVYNDNGELTGGLLNERDNFYKKDKILERIQRRRATPSVGELQAKKNEIIAKLTALKLQESDNRTENNLTIDDQTSIEETAEALIKNIEYGVLAGKGVTEDGNFPKDYIRGRLGLQKGFDNSSEYQGLFDATSEYETLQRRKQKVETYKQQAKYGGDADRLAELEAQKVYDRVNSKKKKISKLNS
jgi:hypothetical protein